MTNKKIQKNTEKLIQKLYCYVDESGQDIASKVFVVVAVVSDKEQNKLRQNLEEIEKIAKTGHRKWHKSCSDRRMKYLKLVVERKIGKGEVYYGTYTKPLPYFLPILDLLERAINQKAVDYYHAKIYIDGIDRKKATEMTNALRIRNISLESVKSRRDESEPIIRLSDMWAGCIRVVLKDNDPKMCEFLKNAEAKCYIEDLTNQNPLKKGELNGSASPIEDKSLPKGQAFAE